MLPFDIATISASVSALLAPALPALVGSLGGKALEKAGETAATEAVKKIGGAIGEDAWKQIKQLWGTLCPHLEKSEETKKTVDKLAADVEKDPQKSEKAANVLEFQLQTLLEDNPELAKQIGDLISEAQQAHNGGAVFNIHSQIAKNIVNAQVIHNLTVQ